jgi:putative transposase
MKQNKSYKIAIYPNEKQEILINKTFGCVRYFWNKSVEAVNKKEKPKTVKELREETGWMKEVSFTAVQQKERDLVETRKQQNNKNRKKKVGMLQFKKRGVKDSFRLSNAVGTFGLDQEISKIMLVKIGWVRATFDREIPSTNKILSCTISKDATNKYFASICTEEDIGFLPKTGNSVGIDVGLKSFLVTSDGAFVDNPHFLRENQAKIAKLQRGQSKKVVGSRRRVKMNKKIAKEHKKVRNRRSHFLHNLTTELVRDYDLIAVEDLNVAGMMKNHKLAGSIADVSWSEFNRQLNYKANWYGKEVVKIGRFEPTSKTCNACGWIKKDLTLKDREFVCEICGVIEDRDLNAARNILAIGSTVAQRSVMECKTTTDNQVDAVPCETTNSKGV